MILKSMIHYPDTNSVEATWVDADDVQVKCQSYGPYGMDMLTADLGTDAAQHADMIATVRANIKPIVPPTVEEQQAAIRAQISSLEQSQLMPRATREFMLLFVETNNLTAMPGYAPLKAFDNEIIALRNQL
jgi:hypothetical protein